jgi:hypothetical protein
MRNYGTMVLLTIFIDLQNAHDVVDLQGEVHISFVVLSPWAFALGRAEAKGLRCPFPSTPSPSPSLTATYSL